MSECVRAYSLLLERRTENPILPNFRRKCEAGPTEGSLLLLMFRRPMKAALEVKVRVTSWG